MKIIEQSTSRLVYQDVASARVFGIFGSIFSIGFISIPLSMLIVAGYQSGEVRLTCTRSEPTILCDRQSSHFFGAWQREPQQLGSFTGAEVVTETRKDSDGDEYTVNVLYGITPANQQTNLRLRQNVHGVANQINVFAQGEQPTLTIHEDNRFTIMSLMGLLFPLPFFLFGLKSTQPMGTFQLELDKTERRLRAQVVYKRKAAKVLKEISLDDITAIAVQNEKDSDDDAVYIVYANLNSAAPSELRRGYNRQLVTEFATELQSFLGLQGVPVQRIEQAEQEGESEPVQPEFESPTGDLIYKTEAGVMYRKYERKNLPEAKQQAVNKVEQELQSLDFACLGSMTTSRFPSVVIHAYQHRFLPINAVILQTESLKTVVDLSSTLNDNAFLTTSTMPGVYDMPGAKIFRNSYPDATLEELLKHHGDRLNQLSRDHRGRKPACRDLTQVALSIEDYFQRAPSGVLPMLASYARQLWVYLTNRKAITGA